MEAYFGMVDHLSKMDKIALINHLSETIEKKQDINKDKFLASFGAWKSDKDAEEIISEIRESRRFRKKELDF